MNNILNKTIELDINDIEVEIDINEIIEKLNDDELMDIINSKLHFTTDKFRLKEFLCKITNSSNLISNDDLLNKIKKILK